MTQASDGALLLAALASAEGDDDRAVELLLHMGVGSQPATISYGGYLAAGSASAASERSAWPRRSATASIATRARPAR